MSGLTIHSRFVYSYHILTALYQEHSQLICIWEKKKKKSPVIPVKPTSTMPEGHGVQAQCFHTKSNTEDLKMSLKKTNKKLGRRFLHLANASKPNIPSQGNKKLPDPFPNVCFLSSRLHPIDRWLLKQYWSSRPWLSHLSGVK